MSWKEEYPRIRKEIDDLVQEYIIIISIFDEYWYDLSYENRVIVQSKYHAIEESVYYLNDYVGIGWDVTDYFNDEVYKRVVGCR